MRAIEGELFILSGRSVELDFADRHRFQCLCVDRTRLASELLLSELRKVVSTQFPEDRPQWFCTESLEWRNGDTVRTSMA